jgi:WD40 repeat protein
VAAEQDGRIELIAVRDDDLDPKSPKLVYNPRDKAKQVKYRLLKEGDTVKAGQHFCFLNDELVTAKMEAAKLTREAALVVEQSAKDGVNLSKQKVDISKRGLEMKSVSFADYIQDMITLTRFEENRAQALQTIAKADADYTEARVMLRKHMLVSNVNGIIRNIAHHTGDVVKGGEKILEIQATDVIRLEGNLDVLYAAQVKRGMSCTVEPAIPSAPTKSYAPHRSEVTGVAVTATLGRPLVVSVAADGTARVWDMTKNLAPHSLPHPVPVRCVDCSPAGAKSVLAVTGSDDGKVRVWDLSNPDKHPTECRELGETHAAAVGAIAFSPDGRFLATAAVRDVFIWDAAEGKKLYSLPAEHRDAVTSLQFTPQGTLVTASKDRSLKVWKLGAEKAGLAKTLDHRAGVVDVLGVTSDGGRVVFDQDKGRLDLVALSDRHTIGQIQNTGTTAAFSTLAVFNSDDTLLLTAGGEGELKGGLQVWTVPAAGRGSEVARLFTPGRVAVTAAAFGPSKDNPFLVVGTEKGTVHLWRAPTEAARKPFPGVVVNVDSPDPRYVTVRVEMDNRELNLLDRSTATIIINPDGK